MDKKQATIFKNLCERFNILFGSKCVFIQHRNLNEFRNFSIERINPNHKILLYGRLKRKHIHDGCTNKIIRVGEFLLSYSFVFLFIDTIMLNIVLQLSVTACLSYIFIVLMDSGLNVNWYCWRTKYRKNYINGTLS